MSIENRSNPVLKEQFAELKSLRDEIRVRMHLGSMELRDEWAQLQSKLPSGEEVGQTIKGAAAELLAPLVAELRRIRTQLDRETKATPRAQMPNEAGRS
jgi:hypothetical protein